MKNIRDRLLRLGVLYCFFVFLTTEILSIFNLINRSIISKIYLIILLLILFVSLKYIPKIRWNINLKGYWIWYLLLFLVVFLPLLLIALYYPPNTWDSLTYHLPRVEHWIQNGNVKFYTTNNVRQLFMSPMAEYIILHWRLLAGDDIFVNLVQYSSMIFSIICATLIIKEWKGSKITEMLAAVLVATVPMGIMQSTSTQNDYVTAFFVISSIYFSIKRNFVFLALCVAMGIFTKSTFVIYVLPFGVYWLINWYHQDGVLAWKKVALILFFITLINGFQWYRNYKEFGSVFSSKDMSIQMFNSSVKPKYVISNIVRNIGAQIGLPNIKYNQFIDNVVEKIHNKLGVKSNDYVNSWYSEQYKTKFSIIDGTTGNIFLTFLFFLTGFVLIFNKNINLMGTYILLLAGWLLFNILLKWQPWQSRLELPFYIAICPLEAYFLTKVFKDTRLIKLLMLFMVLFSIPFVIGYIPIKIGFINNSYMSSDRPLTVDLMKFNKTRYEVFLSESSINRSYHELVQKIKLMNIKNIALDIHPNGREYPLWVALRYTEIKAKIYYLNSNISNNNILIKPDIVVYDYIDPKKHFLGNASEIVNLGEIMYAVIK